MPTATEKARSLRNSTHVREKIVIDGIGYVVTLHYDAQGIAGRVVDSQCQCFGHPMRMHSTMNCPCRARSPAEERER